MTSHKIKKKLKNNEPHKNHQKLPKNIKKKLIHRNEKPIN